MLLREIYEFSFDTMKNLTNLSWAGFMMYYFLSSIQSYIFLTKIEYPRIGPILLRIQFLLFYSLITFPWLISTVFWTVLINDFIRDDLVGRLLQINFHAFNFVLMITEIIISSNPVSNYGWLFPLVCSYMYGFSVATLKFCFNVKWYDANNYNCRPYAFLEYLFEETTFGVKVLAVILETFLLILLYFLSYGLIFLKNKMFYMF